ncbi:MAG: hypothetical protein AB7P37_11930 [Ramlibacter sp.]
MMDIELVTELDVASRNVTGVARVPTEVAASYVQGLAEAFVADPSSFHWWESLKSSATRIPYGADDGLATLISLIGDQTDVCLVVTDEVQPPWPVYAGNARQLIAMLRECRFCEYIFAPHDMSWVIFDTHMNELVCVGLER